MGCRRGQRVGVGEVGWGGKRGREVVGPVYELLRWDDLLHSIEMGIFPNGSCFHRMIVVPSGT